MKLCQTTADLQEEVALAKAAGKSIGLVPTMGALHEGHGSLITAARKENELVIVSVFVNPTQFGPGEDLEAYPRTLEADCILAGKMGADIVFAPAAKEMYPSADMTWVEVTGDITKVLCGRSRPSCSIWHSLTGRILGRRTRSRYRLSNEWSKICFLTFSCGLCRSYVRLTAWLKVRVILI